MYNKIVIQRRLDRLKQEKGLNPVYHSKAEAQRNAAHLDSLVEYTDKGHMRKLRELDLAEINWIRNERLLCRLDFHYFSSRYCKILTAEKKEILFEPWPSQEIALDIIGEMEIEQLAVMLIFLKARQLGVSSIVSLAGLHRLCFYKNVNAVIASSTPDKTRLLGDMFDFVYTRLPWWLVPDQTARREGELLEFGGINSGITFQHGSQITGISRGNNPSFGHLTELAEFINPESIVDASLMRAMHDTPSTFLVLEGTAQGRGNWWHRKWLSSKAGWPTRASRLRPVFLPWFCGTALYPTDTWLRAHPVPESYIAQPWVTEHARRAAEYVSSDPLLTKYLGSGWQMPIYQQWFYEVDRGQHTREGHLNRFLQEMPASDDEAFQSTNISVFSTEVIAAHREATRTPIGVYGITGPSDLVPARLRPDVTQVDSTRAPIPVNYTFHDGHHYAFQLVPLRWSGYSTDSGTDKIYLYEMPEPGQIYGIGVDTAEGIGKDRTSIEVLRKGNTYNTAGQVAEFCSDRINALDAVPFCMVLGAFFSQEKTQEGHLLQARMAIECKSTGTETQHQMRMHGWSNFHPWQRVDGKTLNKSQYNKIGVFTNSWFRSSLMEYLIKMCRDMEIEIRSPFLIQEMESLEGDEFRQSMKAAHGEFDDKIMALGIILISLYQHERDRPVSVTAAADARQRLTTNPAVVRSYAHPPLNPQESDMTNLSEDKYAAN